MSATENLLAISDQLKLAREEQQQTIEEMHCLTGLSPKVLQGLERGNFEIVEPVFVRMGLHTYAEQLGLDVTAIMRVYDKEFAPRPNPLCEIVGDPPAAPCLPFIFSSQIRRILQLINKR